MLTTRAEIPSPASTPRASRATPTSEPVAMRMQSSPSSST